PQELTSPLENVRRRRSSSAFRGLRGHLRPSSRRSLEDAGIGAFRTRLTLAAIGDALLTEHAVRTAESDARSVLAGRAAAAGKALDEAAAAVRHESAHGREAGAGL